jgi:hypothetical protein
MARVRTHRTTPLAFEAIEVEGALIAPAMLARIAQHQAGGQTEADYGVPKGLALRDEIARYFRIGQALFAELSVTQTPSLAATIAFVEALLRDVFGFADVRRAGAHASANAHGSITLQAWKAARPSWSYRRAMNSIGRAITSARKVGDAPQRRHSRIVSMPIPEGCGGFARTASDCDWFVTTLA